jgi:NIMA (never in mitosis gene a)-related kinase 2
VTRERDVAARESALAEKEAQLTSVVAAKDTELASLRALLATAEETHQAKVREALLKREDELRALILKQEADVAARMARREEEIMDAVRTREEDIAAMWADWERETREGMARAVEERMKWVQERTAELEAEHERLLGVQKELERRCEQAEKELAASRNQGQREGKTPLENVKNLMRQPLWEEEPHQTPLKTERFTKPPVFATPITKSTVDFSPPSAMRGVVLTETGEKLATPSPAEFAKLFIATPKVALNFTQIFDFDSEAEDSAAEQSYETEKFSLPGTARGHKRVAENLSDSDDLEDEGEEDLESTPKPVHQPPTARPTRLRRPSIRASSSKPITESSSAPSLVSRSKSTSSASSASSASSSSTVHSSRAKSRSRPPSSASNERTSFVPQRDRGDPPEYDLSDEENLPSPFLKKVDRERIARTTSAPAHGLPTTTTTLSAAGPASARTRLVPRKSGANTLRAVAVVNAANAAGSVPTSKSAGTLSARTVPTRAASAMSAIGGHTAGVRSSIQKAQRASEEARKALFRP